MTGYGRSSTQACGESADTGQGWAYTWEIKSVNSRHLDTKWRLPHSVRCLEQEFETLVRSKASRGRVEINLHLSIFRPELLGVRLNRPLVRAMIDEVRALAENDGLDFLPDYNRFFTISSLWEEDSSGMDASMAESLSHGLSKALDDWNGSRHKEGESLYKDLSSRLATLFSLHAGIAKRVAELGPEKAKALEDRLAAFLAKHELQPDEHLLLQEVAILSDKMDVSEELTRLQAHLELVGELLEAGGECGKKLDFTLQECFREINTCGNKAQDQHVSRLTVDFKAELEKCREQVQNIE
ncbi:MAG: YicC/YloC family endoribonuclease [Oceanidesulfovibrio sp.]